MDTSNIYCCIAECNRVGRFRDPASGRLYCEEHWHDECSRCNAPPCDMIGCDGAGVVTQAGTGAHFCVNHAWRADRPALGTSVNFTDNDVNFLKRLNIKLDGDNR